MADRPPRELEVPDGALRTYKVLRTRLDVGDDELLDHIRRIATPVIVAEVSRLAVGWVTTPDVATLSFRAGWRMSELRALYPAIPADRQEAPRG